MLLRIYLYIFVIWRISSTHTHFITEILRRYSKAEPFLLLKYSLHKLISLFFFYLHGNYVPFYIIQSNCNS